ncbi:MULTISPECIES: LysR family transcriptional regulator [unclassified Bradyrhizobium]|jgi:hypothetical protein|uniref:helix-turn-helix domain-containing protein n=1 Tax=unclassified Bradyrhizobium TaxID=2631580 RepID=UPI001FE1412D|nr:MULTISPECIES: LysR family transcriptional regulator [unclassified Bradyrhizobium]
MTEINNRNDQRNAARAVDLQQLRLAVAACDHGSFRRAAEAPSIKHTAFSRAIGQLEYLDERFRELGSDGTGRLFVDSSFAID